MPPRYAYWTILIDSKPTAFRAREREELLPTFAQLRRTNSDVVMKWFARGRLWDSPEAEREAQRRPPVAREKRGGDWRPGGAHKDPRDRFKKKNRPQQTWSDKDASVRRDREKLGPPPGDGASRDKPSRPAAPPGAPRTNRPWSPKPGRPPSGGPPRSDRPPWSKSGKPPSGAPRGDRPWSNKPPSSAQRSDRPWTKSSRPPGGGAPRGDRPWTKSSKPPSGTPRGERPWTKPSGPPAGGAPRGDRPWHSKPSSGAPRSDRPWADKPRGKPQGAPRPWGAKPQGSSPPWRDKPGGPPRGDRPWQNNARDGRPFTPRSEQPPRKRRDDDPDK